MSTLALVSAVVALLGAGIIYGTDVFCALVVRPAAATAADSSIVDLIGRIHEYGDRRLPVPGVVAILGSGLALAGVAAPSARVGAAVALVALLGWLAVYVRISAPINKQLRAAAAAHTVPADTRALQRRWDAVIWPRAALQAVAVVGLVTVLVGS